MTRPGRCLLIVFFTLLIVPGASFSDEGMWPLYDLDRLPLPQLQQRGLELTLDQIHNDAGTGVADAVVSLGGGTGSFVSPEGLIITNHHVAFGALQRASTLENNYIRDGFYAPAKEAEIRAIGSNAYVTLAVEDVTDRVLRAVTDDMPALERHLALDQMKKEIVAEAEQSGDVYCSLHDMYGGLRYVLYTFLKIQDIRIVYAPPESIGAYGGDIDNWMWPRHCGDFSFLRAYVAPDGSPAAYSTDNVPYRPNAYLKVASAGVYDGDLTLMIGFPGHTDRYASSRYLDYLMNFYYPRSAEISEEILRIFAAAGAADSSASIRLASWVSGINNGLKKSYGLREGFRRANAVELKRKTERELAAFIAADPDLDKKYGHVLGELDSLFEAHVTTREHDMVLRRLGQADYLQLAIEVYRWTVEREKEDMDRERGFQQRDTARTRRWLENAQINLVPAADKDLLRYFFHLAFNLPEGQRIKAIDSIFAGMDTAEREARLDEWLYNAYGQSAVGDLEERMRMFGMTREEIESLDDPFVNLARSLMPELDAARERKKAGDGATSRLHPLLLAAYSEWKNGSMYPDANGTKRLNHGSVRGYSPRDGVLYTIKTSLSGIIEKEIGEDPFIVEPVLKQAWQKKNFEGYLDRDLNDIPVNFLTDNDGTGGNSGSPVLNGRGELVGLDFDSNYEGVAADYIYDENLARSIVVDIRYALFLMERVYHTENLLQELEIH